MLMTKVPSANRPENKYRENKIENNELWDKLISYNEVPIQTERILISENLLSMSGNTEITKLFLGLALGSDKTASYFQALLDYIINSHHKYALDSIPVIEETIVTLGNEIKNLSPEFSRLEAHFKFIKDILEKHFILEETVLFRYLKILIFSYKSKLTMPGAPFVSISNSVRKMEADDIKVKSELDGITEICSGLQETKLPEILLLVSKLEEFRDDLLVHMYLEDKILYPYTMEVERRVNRK